MTSALQRIAGGFAIALLGMALTSVPAAAAVTNDTPATAAALTGLPVALSVDLTQAVTSSPARTGCYRDAFYLLPAPSSASVNIKVTGSGRVVIFPNANTAGWETATAYADVTSTSTVNRWSSTVLMVVCSTLSAGSNVTVTIEGDLTAPTLTTVRPGYTSMTVEWVANASAESTLDGFVVMYRTPAGSWNSSMQYSSGTTSATISNLYMATSYEVKVSARSVTGKVSDSASLTRITSTPNSSPSLNISPEIGGLRIGWQQATDLDLTSGIVLTITCTGRSAITKTISGTAANSIRIGALDPAAGCSIAAYWDGSYGYDGPVYNYPASVAPLAYPALASATFVRESGRGLLKWGAPSIALPSTVSINSYVISIACSSPTYNLSGAVLSSANTSFASTSIQLGATCSGTVQPRYTDDIGTSWSGPVTNVAATRIMEPPANPSALSLTGTSTALVFKLSIPTSFGREPAEVVVTQSYNGSIVNTYNVSIAESAVTVPVSDAVYGQLHDFSMVSKNAAGSSSAATWQQMMPSRAETPVRNNIIAVTAPSTSGSLQLNVSVALDGSRPWMKDSLAKFKTVFVNNITGQTRESVSPVIGTTKFEELLPFSPANSVSVSVMTLLGSSEPLVLKVGSEDVNPPAFGSIRNPEARSLTLLWDAANLSGSDLVRVETYLDGAYVSSTYAPAGSGSTTIDNLTPETSYTFAVFLFDTTRALHSWKPLILTGATNKVIKPTAPTSGTTGGSSSASAPKAPASTPKQSATSSGAVKVTAKVIIKKTIVCVKGALKKTITGISPKCPVGWKKK